MVSSLSYKFEEFQTPVGLVQRPFLPVRIQYRNKPPVDTKMLVDSGADVSVILREFAEDALEIDVERLPRSRTSGVGGETEVGLAETYIRLGYGKIFHELKIPVQIPLSYESIKYNLLGRHPFFYEFDVSFRMGYSMDLGKFVLKKVEKRRPSNRYK